MTAVIAQEMQGRRKRVDLSWPVFGLLAGLLSVLVLLPLFWLLFYSFRSDRGGGFTFSNFAALITDPTLTKAYGLALGMSLAVGVLSLIHI